MSHSYDNMTYLYSNPDGNFFLGFEVFLLIAGAIAAYQEYTGVSLSYTNFSLGRRFKFQLKSRKGMVGVYLPSAVVSLSFFLFRLNVFPLPTVCGKVGLASVAGFLQQHASENQRVTYLSAIIAMHFSKRVLEVIY